MKIETIKVGQAMHAKFINCKPTRIYYINSMKQHNLLVFLIQRLTSTKAKIFF